MKANPRGKGKALPMLFHGTTTHRARSIMERGFRRSKTVSYTGTAVNLTESICIAWEYGPDRGGKVLAVTLDPQTQWQDAKKLPIGQTYDSLFAAGKTDALRTYGGNVWLLWTLERAQVRLLTLTEIMALIVSEFRRDGPNHGYNGYADHLATLFWHGEEKVYAEFPICAPLGFDAGGWKRRKIAYLKTLLALVDVQPGDGGKTR
jgi:hypothetical protein